MNKQEIFDTVFLHLMNQGKVAVFFDHNGQETCAYRGPNNMKCAVGCLIRDDEYTPDMEDNDVSQLYKKNLLPKRFVGHINLLAAMQCVHDMMGQFDSIDDFRENIICEFRLLAKNFDLSTSVIDNWKALHDQTD